MQINNVVARFKDGTLLKGRTCDFLPNKMRFHLQVIDGEIVNLNIEQLKALYIVKDFSGNKERKDDYSYAVPGGGHKIKVKFNDGESIIGYTLCYSSNRHGFFMTPADRRSNNERIFVIKSATEAVEFLESDPAKVRELVKPK